MRAISCHLDVRGLHATLSQMAGVKQNRWPSATGHSSLLPTLQRHISPRDPADVHIGRDTGRDSKLKSVTEGVNCKADKFALVSAVFRALIVVPPINVSPVCP